jgi:hypothetical protein
VESGRRKKYSLARQGHYGHEREDDDSERQGVERQMVV